MFGRWRYELTAAVIGTILVLLPACGFANAASLGPMDADLVCHVATLEAEPVPYPLGGRVRRLYKQSDLAEATFVAVRAVRLSERILVRNGNAFFAAGTALANLYQTQGRTDEAEEILKRLIARSDTSKVRNQFLDSHLRDLALLYDNKGLTSEADGLWKQWLAIHEVWLSQHGIDVQAQHKSILDEPRCIGDDGGLEKLYRLILIIRERSKGWSFDSSIKRP